MDFDLYRTWIGKTEEVTDIISPFQANALAATLDSSTQFVTGSALPHLWHWMYFLTAAPRATLDRDGHPKRGGFLPPIDLPRRMWAGGRLEFFQHLRVGDMVTKRSEILDVKHKSGKSGDLVFVTVRHSLIRDNLILVNEEQDIVYRGESSATPAIPKAAPVAAQASVPPADFTQCITPDPVLLYRYSALTFNGHRIHYDQPYATKVEGYPGLVIHGPLIATLLMQLLTASKPNAAINNFSFRALNPLFDTAPFTVSLEEESGKYQLRAINPNGVVAMEATVSI